MDTTKFNELKVQALLEKISSLTANYENQVADLRVQLTLMSESIEIFKSGGAPDEEVSEGEDKE